MNPNNEQKKLIESLNGLYLVDAGAGTGKTFSVTERYVNLLNDHNPDDILLATFTRNAAKEMSDRIAERSEYTASEIYNAPISTFHSHCQRILDSYGLDAPRLLGLHEELGNVNTLESNIRELQYFEEFYGEFRSQHEEYHNFYALIRDNSTLLYLVKSLASRGIIPEETGWFLNSETYLEGDYSEFRKLFKELNRPRENGDYKKQSVLRQRIYSYKYKNLPEDAPEHSDIVGDRGCKQVRLDFCKKSFEEDRERLKQFIHDLYYEYLKFCLRNNYINFGFVMALTFVTLYENENARRDASFKHIMIDEFQDTNEIQLKISLLLAEKPNICVVGDWKQSIYSFQYADIDNIRKFENRINSNIDELNRGKKRVAFSDLTVETIELKKNYRSSQNILDSAEQAFTLRGNSYEEVKKPNLVSLESQTSSNSEVKKLVCEDEKKNILAEIQTVKDEKNLEYSDIAVLSRTRSFALELQQEANNYNIPAAYEGGLELFNTSEAKILLAWLRAIRDSRKGWAVILERTGYSMLETKEILKEEKIPENLEDFRNELEGLEIEALSRKVFDTYGFENPITEKIIEVLTQVYRSSYMTWGDVIRFIEDNIEESEIYEVDTSTERDCVKIQTVHGAKGLEYRVVFIADVNQGRFPSRNANYSPIIYDDVVGIRQRKIFDEENQFVFDNWKSEILSNCIGSRYDEERRLMYVAMTRAEQYLYISAEEERESKFFQDLELDQKSLEDSPVELELEDETKPVLTVKKPDKGGKRVVSASEKFEISETNTESAQLSRDLHKFLEGYINGDKEPKNGKEKKIAMKVNSLNGELDTGVKFRVPKDGVVYKGQVDILAVEEDKATIIELKTSDDFEKQANKQLELYKDAIDSIYPDKKIIGEIFEV